MRCPYCNYLCKDDDKVCIMCNSILPPPDYEKNVIVNIGDMNKNQTIPDDDNSIIKISKEKHFKKLFDVDAEMSGTLASCEPYKGDIASLFSELKEYIASTGIDISDDDLRSVFASVISGHMVYVKNNVGIDSLLRCINSFFGNKIISEITPYNADSDLFGTWMFDENGDKYYNDTDWLKGIYVANIRDNLNIILFKDSENDFSTPYMEFINQYAKNPYILKPIRISGISSTNITPKFFPNDGMDIPDNLCFAVLENGNAIASNGVYPVIDIPADIRLKTDNISEGRPISVSTMRGLCEKSRKENYLSEDIWKKIDFMENWAINKNKDFAFGNRMLQNMEKYSSLFIASGGSVESTLDSMIASYILPKFFTAMSDYLNLKNDIGNLLKNKFEEYSLTRCKKILEQ